MIHKVSPIGFATRAEGLVEEVPRSVDAYPIAVDTYPIAVDTYPIAVDTYPITVEGGEEGHMKHDSSDSIARETSSC